MPLQSESQRFSEKKNSKNSTLTPINSSDFIRLEKMNIQDLEKLELILPYFSHIHYYFRSLPYGINF